MIWIATLFDQILEGVVYGLKHPREDDDKEPMWDIHRVALRTMYQSKVKHLPQYHLVKDTLFVKLFFCY